MSDEQILNQINQLKLRVKTIVQNIQALKKQLERAEITLEDFKVNKARMEDELRGILLQIAQVKETAQIQPTIKPQQPPQIAKPIIPAQVVQPKTKIEDEAPPLAEIVPPENTETTSESAETTSEVIDREIQIAKEANDLMYFFQTSFIESVTKADVYLSVTLEDHYIIRIDYSKYPEKPRIVLPPSIIYLYDNDENIFYREIDTYRYWDPDNPSRIYELISEIETVLIRYFRADVDSILQGSLESQQQKISFEDMIEEAETAIVNKNYEKATELLYLIVDKAFDLQDYDAVEKYQKRLNALLKKTRKKSKKK